MEEKDKIKASLGDMPDFAGSVLALGAVAQASRDHNAPLLSYLVAL
jgi:hypothetical protein